MANADDFIPIRDLAAIFLIGEPELQAMVLRGDVVGGHRTDGAVVASRSSLVTHLAGGRKDAILLDLAGAARLLGLTAAQVRACAKMGTLPCLKLPSGVYFFDRDAVREALKGCQSFTPPTKREPPAPPEGAPPGVVTLRAMADRLGVTAASLKAEAIAERVPHYTMGAAYLFDPLEVEAVLAKMAAGGGDATTTEPGRRYRPVSREARAKLWTVTQAAENLNIPRSWLALAVAYGAVPSWGTESCPFLDGGEVVDAMRTMCVPVDVMASKLPSGLDNHRSQILDCLFRFLLSAARDGRDEAADDILDELRLAGVHVWFTMPDRLWRSRYPYQSRDPSTFMTAHLPDGKAFTVTSHGRGEPKPWLVRPRPPSDPAAQGGAS